MTRYTVLVGLTILTTGCTSVQPMHEVEIDQSATAAAQALLENQRLKASLVAERERSVELGQKALYKREQRLREREVAVEQRERSLSSAKELPAPPSTSSPFKLSAPALPEEASSIPQVVKAKPAPPVEQPKLEGPLPSSNPVEAVKSAPEPERSQLPEQLPSLPSIHIRLPQALREMATEAGQVPPILPKLEGPGISEPISEPKPEPTQK